MEKAFLLVFLLTVVSLAQAQSGRWGHVCQINPDTITPNEIQLVHSGNQLWAVWTRDIYVNYTDTTWLLVSRYDSVGWGTPRVIGKDPLYSCYTTLCDGANNSNVFIYMGSMLMKNTNKEEPWGIYQATCSEYDTLWSNLSLLSETPGTCAIDAASGGNNMSLLWEDHVHFSSMDQTWSIYGSTFTLSWSPVQCVAAGMDYYLICGLPTTTVDKNNGIWKGWCVTDWYSGTSYMLYVNGQMVEQNNSGRYRSFDLTNAKDSTIWAFWIKEDSLTSNYNDSIFYRVNESGCWQSKQFLALGNNIEVVSDTNENIWVAITLDSIIYVNYYNNKGWNAWDSVTVGYLKHLSIDQLGNPCLAWYHAGNIYSALYSCDTLAPTISITSPVAGSEYTKGQQVPVQWTASGDAAFLNIYCQRTGSSEWHKLFDMVSVDSFIQWTVPNDSVDYRFKAEAIDYGWNTALDSTGWFMVKPLGVQGNPNEQTKIGFGLRNSGPNPFKQSAVINYQLPQDGPVQVKVYNASGQLVKTIVNVSQNAGAYTARWNGNNEQNIPASAGVYICRLSSGGQTASVKLIKLK